MPKLIESILAPYLKRLAKYYGRETITREQLVSVMQHQKKSWSKEVCEKNVDKAINKNVVVKVDGGYKIRCLLRC